jgi:hypothetical protein
VLQLELHLARLALAWQDAGPRKGPPLRMKHKESEKVVT